MNVTGNFKVNGVNVTGGGIQSGVANVVTLGAYEIAQKIAIEESIITWGPVQVPKIIPEQVNTLNRF